MGGGDCGGGTLEGGGGVRLDPRFLGKNAGEDIP
jgi:hypothetical protein